jgi:hypothetical protein
MERSVISRLLAYPVAWFVVQLAEFVIAVWVVRRVAPNSWPVSLAILAVLIGAFTIVNLRLRRRFLAEDQISGDVSKN